MFYLLDKPKGISSFKAIKEFAKANGLKKVGHTGTLDPLASGLLLIASEADTKLIDYVDKGFKSYRATMILGQISNTYDIEGEIKKQNIKSLPSEVEISNALKSFAGKSKQMPPAFSAKKVNGKRAYDLARSGKDVKLRTHEVQMKDFVINRIEGNKITFEVTVSRGTYIRSLIHDVGQKLKTGALMSDLRRITIGPLAESDLNKEVDVKKILTLPVVKLNNIDDLKNGKVIESKNQDGKYAVEFKNEIVGIVEVKDKMMKVNKLLGNKL